MNAAPPEIVLKAHSDLARVKELLAEDAGLLNVMYKPWQETPLGAASHVGNVPIAEFLLAQGAPLTICTAAMLGRQADVQAFLQADPAQANATGAHGISLLFHAALGGSTDIAAMIVAAGGSTAPAAHAMHGAVMKGRGEMVRWLLSHDPDLSFKNFQGKTPLEAAQDAGHAGIVAILQAHTAHQ